MFFVYLFVFCTVSLETAVKATGVTPIPYTTPINGLIEAFYWSASDAVNNVHDMYSKQQRDQLISSMGDGINYYFHSPGDSQDRPFTMTLWNEKQMADWSDTVLKAKKSNVSIVVGLRPGGINTLQNSTQSIKRKLDQLALVGIRYYILAWDDVPGAGTEEQMALQKDLINALVKEVKNVELLGVVPAYYALSMVSANATNNDWAKQLDVLNQVPSSIRFFVTGTSIVPWSIQITDVPSLKNRQFIFFDNWIAVDTNSKVAMTWPPNRNADTYKANGSISGSVLNLAYPPERIVHQVYATKQRINNKATNSSKAAEYWAAYLVANKFYEKSSLEELKNNLQSSIDNHYETNTAIIQHYPLLQRIFTN